MGILSTGIIRRRRELRQPRQEVEPRVPLSLALRQKSQRVARASKAHVRDAQEEEHGGRRVQDGPEIPGLPFVRDREDGNEECEDPAKFSATFSRVLKPSYEYKHTAVASSPPTKKSRAVKNGYVAARW